MLIPVRSRRWRLRQSRYREPATMIKLRGTLNPIMRAMMKSVEGGVA